MLLGFSRICFRDWEERSVKILPGNSVFQPRPGLIPRVWPMKTHLKEYTQNAGCRGRGGRGRGRAEGPCIRRAGRQRRPAHPGALRISYAPRGKERLRPGRAGRAAPGSMTRCSCCNTWPWHQPARR